MGSFFRLQVYDIVSPHVKDWIPVVSGTPDSLRCIPDSVSKLFPDSGIRIPLHGAKWYGFYQQKYI